MSKKPPFIGFEPGGVIAPDGSFRFLEISFVANPPDPRARVFNRHCDSCDADFASGMHPDNGCVMRVVFNTMED